MRHAFILAAVVALSATYALRAEEVEAPVRKLIRDGVAAGKRPHVYVDVPEKATRAQVLSTDEQGVEVMAREMKLRVAWKELSAERLSGMASEFAATGAELLIVLRFCVEKGLAERSEKLSQAVLEADASLRDEVVGLLARLPKDPPKPAAAPPKPDLAKLTGESRAAPPPARANHEGRVLPPLPPMKAPVMFNTPEADEILDAMQVFPKDNAWNEDISKLPVHPDSDKIVRNVGADTNLHVDVSENFILIPPDQPKVEVKITTYKSLSDKGPFPMPDNAPIQGWGIEKITLEHIQRVGDGDRHIVLVDPHNGKLYEFFEGRRTDAGWEAAIACVFDLNSNKTRPKNWTSADAAGLAMFPGMVKFHELERGRVEHAIRLTVSKTRKAFIYPATHPYAGHTDDPCFPAMGQRFRLKAGVDISKLPKQALPIAVALKKYGMIVADNGRDWDICATPDKRINYDQMRALHKLKGSDFEVVVTTGEKEGPRAGGP